nr:protein cdc73 like [Quercus suber]
MKSCILCGIDIELYVGLVFAVLGFFIQFEDDSLEFAKTVKQLNAKIISVPKRLIEALLLLVLCVNVTICGFFFRNSVAVN